MKKEPWIKVSDIVFFACALVTMLLARHFIFTPIEVIGASMNPTLQDSERLFGLKVGEIKRLDVVSFAAPDVEDKDYIKRVIGLPGEEVLYEDDQLYIDGEKIDEPYLAENKKALPEGMLLTDDFVYTVPKGTYFVMGDNRQNSKDSRMLGAIDEEEIFANAKVVFWPINKMGTVD
ncbi:signal peptidase I [Enterococcus sp. AZ163]|uniref:signal peptidase I n=1 Tax=Enterococcus sp. AZ163 TaxID=2774638 RepID=UPI003D28ADC4